MNVIEFKPILDNTYLIYPKPTIESLPEWYKKSRSYLDNDNKNIILPRDQAKLTYKKCVPFLDALSCGYFIFLNHDLYVDQSGENGYTIQWRVSNKPQVDQHTSIQIKDFVIDENVYNKFPYKWINFFYIKTKPGYSCLFTHPLNRLDLPFITLSGVVDTDKHGVEINFPFLLKNNFNGIINKGTPIVQIIPFKRQNWRMKLGELYNNTYKTEELMSFANNAYKKLYWSRKSYR